MFQKLTFSPGEGEDIELYVIEQTRIGGVNYLLVTEDADGDGEAMILKDLAADTDQDSLYEFVTEDEELDAVGNVFASMLEDVDFIRGDE